jgi:hypothetical protein
VSSPPIHKSENCRDDRRLRLGIWRRLDNQARSSARARHDPVRFAALPI